MDLKQAFSMFNCAHCIVSGGTYIASILLQENRYYIRYVNEYDQSDFYCIDHKIVEGEGLELEDAIKDLKNDFDEKLKAQGERRHEKIPGQLSDKSIDTKELRDAISEYMKFLNSDEYCEDDIGDHEHVIMEKAVELIYGEGIWDYINSKII